jgi:hypothetical protein
MELSKHSIAKFETESELQTPFKSKPYDLNTKYTLHTLELPTHILLNPLLRGKNIS